MSQLVPSSTPLRTFEGHENTVKAVAVLPDMRRMVTGSYDKTLRLWDLETGVVLKMMEGHSSRVLALAVSRDGQIIASGDEGGEIIAWHGETGESLTKPIKAGFECSNIMSVDFSPDGTVLVTGSVYGMTKFWCTKTWQMQGKPIKDRGDCIRYSPSGQLLAIATTKDIQIYNPGTCESIAALTARATSLAWTPDGTRLLSGGAFDDPTIREWDPLTWQQVGLPWKGHANRIVAIAVDPDGTLVASASWDKHVRLWGLSDRQNIGIFKHSRILNTVTFLVDGRHILSGGYDNKISQWDILKDANSKILAMSTPSTLSAELRQQYFRPSQVERAIRQVIDAQLENAPRRVLDTITGLLCDREAQISTFKMSIEYKELLLSAIARPDLHTKRIKEVVRRNFQYAMLSHRWEGKEPLLQDIQGKSVYDSELNSVGGMTKLRSFCKTAHVAGYNWAWSDTCCIDKTNNVELHESVNSMFVWYHHSALTIVYLSDVPPSSKSGALSKSAWNTRGWTVQEFIAPNVILFYQSNWTLYLDDRTPNHKDSIAIMQELKNATGIDRSAVAAFHPSMDGVREKLHWASTRDTTRQEDIAYSLFGIFGVRLPVDYGEKQDKALGRLLQEIVARSGDITGLDWVGTSSDFNSCLPASITAYQVPPYKLPSLSEDEIQSLVSLLRKTVTVDFASNLYTQLRNMSAPRFATQRLHLPCIAFDVREVRRVRSPAPETQFTYRVKADGLQSLLVTTEETLVQFMPARPIERKFILVRPLDRSLELPDFVEPSDIGSIAESEGDYQMSLFSPSHDWSSRPPVNQDLELRAFRLLVRLGQSFSAFLLAQQRSGEYKRIASDHDITGQVNDIRNPMNIRTIEIL